MMNEPVFNILNFIQENSSSMNDADFNDSFNMIATKFENDSYKRLNLMSLEKTLGFQQIKKYIQTNFDRLSNDNFTMQNLLFLFTEFSLRNKATLLFTGEQIKRIIDVNIANFENNNAKMSIQALLNVISLLGLSRNVPVNDILRQRNEEASGLNFGLINRILRRCTSEKMGDSVRDNLTRFLVFEMLNQAAGEKMINKCRAFNTVAKLDFINPFNNFNRGKVMGLLKDIRAQAENHDQQSILLMMEALIYYDDPSRIDTLREFYDIVTMTIKHQPENVKLDFIVRFVEFSSKLRNDSALTQEHVKTILDYVVGAMIQTGDVPKRLPQASQFLPLFAFMRKTRYFNKEVVEKIVDHITPFACRFGYNDDIRAMKFMIRNVLGEEYLNNFEIKVVEDISKDYANRPEQSVIGLINVLGKSSRFSGKNNQTSQALFDSISAKLDELLKADRVNIFGLISRYVAEVQEYLPVAQKQIMSEKLLNKISPEDIENYKNPVILISYISDLYIRDNEGLKNKVNELINKVISHPNFQRSLVPTLVKLTRDQSKTLTNNSIYKLVQHIREASKDPQFIADTPKFFERLLTSSFYLVYNLEKDSNYNLEGVGAIISTLDFIYSKNTDVNIDINRSRVPVMLRTFDKARLNSQILNKSLVGFLNNSRDIDRSHLSSDTILVLEKILRSGDIVNENDLEEILKRFIANDEKAASLLNSQNSPSQKITLIKLFANINKKKNSIISDNYTSILKDLLVEEFIKGSHPENIKLNALFALNSFNNKVIDYSNLSKEYIQLIKNVFGDVSIKKIYRYVDQLSLNRSLKLNKRFYLEFATIYEKEESIDKYFLLRIVDKFTNYGWSNPGFYNKVMSDYEKLFDNFSSIEHAQLINFFARVDLNKEDVIHAAVKSINTKQLNDSGKFDLFNDLVKLGFYNQEWRELILEKLLNETDFSFGLHKANLTERINFLNNLWKLGNWPANSNDLANLALQQLKKKPRNLEKLRTIEEEWVPTLRRNPYFTQLDAEIQTAFDAVFDARALYENRKIFYSYFTEYLKAMGHSDFQFYPKNVFCDYLLPGTKQAIIIGGRNSYSLASPELTSNTQFIVDTLKSQGYTPIVVSYNALNDVIMKEKGHQEYVNLLQQAGKK
jgi:hypothetical protein